MSLHFTDQHLLNMDIRAYELYAQYVGGEVLWQMFLDAKKRREAFLKLMEKLYIYNPTVADEAKSK